MDSLGPLRLRLHHRLLLLELHDETGRSRIRDIVVRRIVFAGAMAAELQLQDRLVAAEANRFAISAVGAPADGSLGLAEAALAGRKPHTLHTIITRLGNWGSYRWAGLVELEAMGAVRRETDRILGVPWRNRWPTADATVRASVIEHLRTWLWAVGDADPPGPEDLLLSLLRVAKLYGAFLSDAEQRTHAAVLEERTKRAPIGITVRKVMEGAMINTAAAASF